MTAFTQQTFLGASIRGFRSSVGWGDNPSTLNVSVVEDAKNNDAFQQLLPGTPVIFKYSDWSFGGIIQSWHRDYSIQVAPAYDIIVVDPREVLNGVQLILSGYNGTTFNVPNLLNIYGYLEDPSVLGFGGAQLNDAGIPWQNVIKGITDLTNGVNPTYGGQISLAGFQYKLDLSGLPNLPSFYRVPSSNMSIMDFIHFICEATNCDFFFGVQSTAIGRTIYLVTVPRNVPPIYGAIDNFIANVGGASVKSAGFEFRNETTSKFVVGGPVSQLYFQAPTATGVNSSTAIPADQNIVWPYWGLDYNQNAIIGQGVQNFHQFNIPTRNSNIFGVGDYYPTDVNELMFANTSIEAWTNYLIYNNFSSFTRNEYDFYIDLVNTLAPALINTSTLQNQNIDSDIKTGAQNFLNNSNYREIPYIASYQDSTFVVNTITDLQIVGPNNIVSTLQDDFSFYSTIRHNYGYQIKIFFQDNTNPNNPIFTNQLFTVVDYPGSQNESNKNAQPQPNHKVGILNANIVLKPNQVLTGRAQFIKANSDYGKLAAPDIRQLFYYDSAGNQFEYPVIEINGNIWYAEVDIREFLSSNDNKTNTPNPQFGFAVTYLSKIDKNIGTGTFKNINMPGWSPNFTIRNLINNPHVNKYSTFNMGGYIKDTFPLEVAKMSDSRIFAVYSSMLPGFNRNNISTFSQTALPNVPDTLQQNIAALYELISSYSRTYYGQQFQVMIPFVDAVIQSETNSINPTNVVLSQQPVSSAFVDENDFATAITNNYLPGNIDRMLDSNYKVRAYARYNDITNLDFSHVPAENLILSDNGKSAFIICDVEPLAVFEDFDILFSPRVIFKLPGPVFTLSGGYSANYDQFMNMVMAGELTRIYWGSKYLRTDWRFKYFSADQSLNAIEKLKKLLTSQGASPGHSALSAPSAGLYVMPDLIAIPLQSNIQQYGPWYAVGANGKLSFSEDHNLVPWNFGGYDELDDAGNAAVQSAITQSMVFEGGSITFPGVPTVTIGNPLLEGGPYVTDISVDVGQNNVTTTYTMATWTPHPYSMRKEYTEYIARINKQAQEARHLLRVIARSNEKETSRITNRVIRDVLRDIPHHKRKHSPIVTVMGTVDQVESNKYQSTIVFDTDYGLASSLGEPKYMNTGGATLDTLFTPFSTFPSIIISGIPSFNVNPSGSYPTVNDLHPFTISYDSSGNVLSDVYYGGLVRSTTVPNSLIYDSEQDSDLETSYVRGIAMKAPLILAGWGFDVDGNPVPSGTIDSSGTLQFSPNYKMDMQNWKCGPLDTRWDDSRGVWVTGSNSQQKIVFIGSNTASGIAYPNIPGWVYPANPITLTFPPFASGIPDLTQPATLTMDGSTIYVANFRSNVVTTPGYYLANKINGNWILDNQAVFLEEQG